MVGFHHRSMAVCHGHIPLRLLAAVSYEMSSAPCLLCAEISSRPTWGVRTRRAPSRHCRDARVYRHTTASHAWHAYAPSARLRFVHGVCPAYTSHPDSITSRPPVFPIPVSNTAVADRTLHRCRRKSLEIRNTAIPFLKTAAKHIFFRHQSSSKFIHAKNVGAVLNGS